MADKKIGYAFGDSEGEGYAKGSVSDAEQMAQMAQYSKEYANFKGGKLDLIPLEQIEIDYGRNIRFKEGQEFEGVTFKKGSYNIATLKHDIITQGMIREPIVVSKREIGGKTMYRVLRGFRRVTAAREIIAEGQYPDVIKSLRKLWCIVLTGLDDRQELNLVNDQTSQQFNKVEILRDVWRRLRSGQAWYDIGATMPQQIAILTGSIANANKVMQQESYEGKVKEAKTWLVNYMYQFLQGVLLHGGPKLRKHLVTQYKIDSGLAEPEEKVPFQLTATTWPKIAAAIKDDQIAGKWDAIEGTGPAFQSVYEELGKPKQRKVRGLGAEHKAIPGGDIKGLSDTYASCPPLADAFRRCLDGQTVDIDSWKVILEGLLAKKAKFDESRGFLPADIRRLLSLVFDVEATPDDFVNYLSEHMVTVEPEPEPEVAEEPEPEATEEPELVGSRSGHGGKRKKH